MTDIPIPPGINTLFICIGVVILTVMTFAFFVKVLRDPHYGERD